METMKFFRYLIILLAAAFLTGCPVDEDDIIGDSTVTITNNEAVVMDEIAIDDSCIVADGGWNGISGINLAAGQTGSYTVASSIASDTYDVRVCNVGANSCFIWFFVGPGGATLDTAAPDAAAGKLANC